LLKILLGITKNCEEVIKITDKDFLMLEDLKSLLGLNGAQELLVTLYRVDDEDKYAEGLRRVTGLSQSYVTNQLQALEDVGLVESRMVENGYKRMYELTPFGRNVASLYSSLDVKLSNAEDNTDA